MIVFEGLGDMFNCRSQTLTCPVNVVGTLGNGLAKEFRDNIPGLLEYYRGFFPRSHRVPEDRSLVNQLYVYPIDDSKYVNAQVLLFPTKEHWRFPSRLAWVDQNLQSLARRIDEFKITSLAVPALGCGHGGLNYERQVRALIHEYLGPLKTPVEILLR